MEIRPAVRADLADLARIQGASPEAAQWDAEAYLAHDCSLAVEGATALGFVVTRPTGPGEHEILNLAVASEARRRGVGTALLAHALGPGGDWFLEVRESNIGARRLYGKAGFTVAGVRPNYYASPVETGIVMKLGKC